MNAVERGETLGFILGEYFHERTTLRETRIEEVEEQDATILSEMRQILGENVADSELKKIFVDEAALFFGL